MQPKNLVYSLIGHKWNHHLASRPPDGLVCGPVGTHDINEEYAATKFPKPPFFTKLTNDDEKALLFLGGWRCSLIELPFAFWFLRNSTGATQRDDDGDDFISCGVCNLHLVLCAVESEAARQFGFLLLAEQPFTLQPPFYTPINSQVCQSNLGPNMWHQCGGCYFCTC